MKKLLFCSAILTLAHVSMRGSTEGYAREFAKGFGVGAVTSAGIEFARHNVLPDMTDWKLYDNFGMCRDQLTGEAKIMTAVLATAAIDYQRWVNLKKLAAQIAGIFTGVCVSNYLLK